MDNHMTLDRKTVEKLVEVIAQEVVAVFEERQIHNLPNDGKMSMSCGDGYCVKTHFDEAGHIVNIGAERIASTLGMIPDNTGLAAMIDHTLLKPDATSDQITQLCKEAKQFHFASVCVNPAFVKQCADLLYGSDVKVCTVIGFPLGASASDVKVFETETALNNGATEIDMVINIGALKARNLDLVARDIRSVVMATHARKALLKVIIETALLTDEEKVLACLISKEAGADFVKTSTGFSGGGATVEDITLMRRVVGPGIGVKASGGIRNRETAEKMVLAGATRLGASAGVKIIKGDQAKDGSASSGY
jgi:deoxyribose-phosphate aldolase